MTCNQMARVVNGVLKQHAEEGTFNENALEAVFQELRKRAYDEAETEVLKQRMQTNVEIMRGGGVLRELEKEHPTAPDTRGNQGDPAP